MKKKDTIFDIASFYVSHEFETIILCIHEVFVSLKNRMITEIAKSCTNRTVIKILDDVLHLFNRFYLQRRTSLLQKQNTFHIT